MESKAIFNKIEFENKLKANLDAIDPHARTTLKKSMEYSLLSPGKRIRPQLVYEVSARLGLSSHLSDPVAISTEMVHAFSLIHDDLPCMDDDDFRRGLPTNHKIFGEPVALLAGDALLNHAIGTFSALADRVNPSVFSHALQFFIQTIGAKGIMGGQSLELELGALAPSLDRVLKIQSMKTTALFQSSILIPVMLAGYSKTHPIYQQHLEFSEAFGFAFQAADDLADHAQDQAQAQSGKNLISFLSPQELKTKAKRQLVDSPLTSQSPIALWLIEQF